MRKMKYKHIWFEWFMRSLGKTREELEGEDNFFLLISLWCLLPFDQSSFVSITLRKVQSLSHKAVWLWYKLVARNLVVLLSPSIAWMGERILMSSLICDLFLPFLVSQFCLSFYSILTLLLGGKDIDVTQRFFWHYLKKLKSCFNCPFQNFSHKKMTIWRLYCV